MTGEPRWDAAASAVIGGILIAVASFLAYENLGPTAVLVSARVWFRPELTTPQIEEAVRRLEDAARAALPPGTRRRMIVIEPGRPTAVRRAA